MNQVVRIDESAKFDKVIDLEAVKTIEPACMPISQMRNTTTAPAFRSRLVDALQEVARALQISA